MALRMSRRRNHRHSLGDMSGKRSNEVDRWWGRMRRAGTKQRLWDEDTMEDERNFVSVSLTNDEEF